METDLDEVRRRLALMEEFLAWRRLVDRSRNGGSDRPNASPAAAEPVRRSGSDVADRGTGAERMERTERTERSQEPGLLRAAEAAEAADAAEAASGQEATASQLEWLRLAQRALVSHPVATQSAFVALAREGRAFATTEEGRDWARALRHAPAVQRLRTLWEAANFTLTADEAKAPLPSAMIELFVRAAASGEVDDLAARLGMPFLEPSVRSRVQADEEAPE